MVEALLWICNHLFSSKLTETEKIIKTLIDILGVGDHAGTTLGPRQKIAFPRQEIGVPRWNHAVSFFSQSFGISRDLSNIGMDYPLHSNWSYHPQPFMGTVYHRASTSYCLTYMVLNFMQLHQLDTN